nr:MULTISPECIES: hypothetical protein [unclassified Nostoc]
MHAEPTTPCGTSGGTARNGVAGRAWVEYFPQGQQSPRGQKTASTALCAEPTGQCGTSGGTARNGVAGRVSAG